MSLDPQQEAENDYSDLSEAPEYVAEMQTPELKHRRLMIAIADRLNKANLKAIACNVKVKLSSMRSKNPSAIGLLFELEGYQIFTSENMEPLRNILRAINRSDIVKDLLSEPLAMKMRFIAVTVVDLEEDNRTTAELLYPKLSAILNDSFDMHDYEELMEWKVFSSFTDIATEKDDCSLDPSFIFSEKIRTGVFGDFSYKKRPYAVKELHEVATQLQSTNQKSREESFTNFFQDHFSEDVASGLLHIHSRQIVYCNLWSHIGMLLTLSQPVLANFQAPDPSQVGLRYLWDVCPVLANFQLPDPSHVGLRYLRDVLMDHDETRVCTAANYQLISKKYLSLMYKISHIHPPTNTLHNMATFQENFKVIHLQNIINGIGRPQFLEMFMLSTLRTSLATNSSVRNVLSQDSTYTTPFGAHSPLETISHILSASTILCACICYIAYELTLCSKATRLSENFENVCLSETLISQDSIKLDDLQMRIDQTSIYKVHLNYEYIKSVKKYDGICTKQVDVGPIVSSCFELECWPWIDITIILRSALFPTASHYVFSYYQSQRNITLTTLLCFQLTMPLSLIMLLLLLAGDVEMNPGPSGGSSECPTKSDCLNQLRKFPPLEDSKKKMLIHGYTDSTLGYDKFASTKTSRHARAMLENLAYEMQTLREIAQTLFHTIAYPKTSSEKGDPLVLRKVADRLILLDETTHAILQVIIGEIRRPSTAFEMLHKLAEIAISLENDARVTFMEAVHEMQILEKTADTETSVEGVEDFARFVDKVTIGKMDPEIIDDKEISAGKKIAEEAPESYSELSNKLETWSAETNCVNSQTLAHSLMIYRAMVPNITDYVPIAALVVLPRLGGTFLTLSFLEELTHALVEKFPDLEKEEQLALLNLRMEISISHNFSSNFSDQRDINIQQALVSEFMRPTGTTIYYSVELMYEHLQKLAELYLSLGSSDLALAKEEKIKTLDKDISKKSSARTLSWNTSKMIHYQYGNDSLVICLTEPTEIQQEYTLVPYVGIYKSTPNCDIVSQEPSVTKERIYEQFNAVLVELLSSFKCPKKYMHIKKPPSVQSEISNDIQQQLQEIISTSEKGTNSLEGHSKAISHFVRAGTESCYDCVPDTYIKPYKCEAAANIDTMPGVTNVGDVHYDEIGKAEEQTKSQKIVPVIVVSHSPPISSEAPISSAVEKKLLVHEEVSSSLHSLTVGKEAASLVHSPSDNKRSANQIQTFTNATVAGSSPAADNLSPAVGEEAVNLSYPQAVAQEAPDSSVVDEVEPNLLAIDKKASQQSAVERKVASSKSSLRTVQESSQPTVDKEVASLCDSSKADNNSSAVNTGLHVPLVIIPGLLPPAIEKDKSQQQEKPISSPIPQAVEEDSPSLVFSVSTNDESAFSAHVPAVDIETLGVACFPAAHVIPVSDIAGVSPKRVDPTCSSAVAEALNSPTVVAVGHCPQALHKEAPHQSGVAPKVASAPYSTAADKKTLGSVSSSVDEETPALPVSNEAITSSLHLPTAEKTLSIIDQEDIISLPVPPANEKNAVSAPKTPIVGCGADSALNIDRNELYGTCSSVKDEVEGISHPTAIVNESYSSSVNEAYLPLQIDKQQSIESTINGELSLPLVAINKEPSLPSSVDELSTNKEELVTGKEQCTLPKEVLKLPEVNQEANSSLSTSTDNEEADSVLPPSVKITDSSSSVNEVSSSNSSALHIKQSLSSIETAFDSCTSPLCEENPVVDHEAFKHRLPGISKKRRKRIRLIPSLKQLYMLKQKPKKKHSGGRIKQSKKKCSFQNQARQRAALRRPHSPQPNSNAWFELCFESSSSGSSSVKTIDNIENELVSFHQVVTARKEAPTQVLSKWFGINHSIQLPTLGKDSHKIGHTKPQFLTSTDMIRLQTFPTPRIVCVQQDTTAIKAAKVQSKEQPCLINNGKRHSNRRVNIHRLGEPKCSLDRGKKGRKVYKELAVRAETFFDYSNSELIHSVFLENLLLIIKTLQTPTSEYTGSSLYGKLRRLMHSNESSLEHLAESKQGSSAQQSSASQTEQSLYFNNVPNSDGNKARVETNLMCEEEVKQEPTSSRRFSNNASRPEDYGARNARTQGNPQQSAPLVRTDGRNHLGMESDQRVVASPDYQQVNVEAARECVPKELRSATSGRYIPEWISAVTQLLHVPDYSKMIQRLNSETPTPEHYVSHRFIRGIAYFKTGKFQQAMRDLMEGETCAQEINQRGGVSLCCVYLGDLYYSSSSYSEAAKCYQKAAEYHTTDSIASQFRMVPPTLSVIHAKCGSCFRTLSKTVEAIQEYKKAIDSAIKEKDRLTAHTSLGNLYQSSGQNSEALKEYEEALTLAEKTNDHISVAWTHGNIGNAHLGLGMKDKALYHLQKALDLTIRYEPTPSAIGRAYNNIGTSYQSMGDLDKAEEHYDLALSQAIYGNDPAGQARVYGNIGNIFIVRKQFEKAIPHYSEVLRLSTDEATVTTALHNRGCAYYEWAESKMAVLEKSLSEKSLTTVYTTFRIHSSKSVSQEHSPRIVIDSIFKLYQQGKEDLQKVLASHERKLDHIKGSTKGLSLTVSLFESNSRTFHRLQDCMVNLGNWREALLVAEQSRARTLGEMMLSRKGSQLDHPLTSPLSLEQIFVIVSSQSSPVLYLSHTGASILGWVIIPIENSNSVSMEMFEVPLSDDQFEGKSFDYHVRYNLTEILVEQSYEMYCSVEYSEKYTEPVVTLYELIGRPLRTILNQMEKADTPQKIVLITDTYTTLLPFASLYDPDSKTFLGDLFRFELALSFLTIGITNQLPDPVVELPADAQSMCIVGNPTIPQFYHHNEVWSLGKLPYAKREAQWVGHILNSPPILDEQATKSAVLMRLMRAKVIHIATHGSSVSGFLAFSALTSTRQGEVVDSSSVLLHPEEVEKLSIRPALVVLSSCDSARGTVKADGIQGMARAFILAGAQAVMTALWRVPDESAAVFMRFFYRFLGEGFESSLALQKSILSLRCFAKYSQYIHWSGYQLTGRSIRFDVTPSPVTKILEATLGKSSVFPRLMLLKKLQSVLVENPRFPTDIQILHGSPGVRPSEVAIDFIHSSHESFASGVYWINCRTPDLVDASIAFIEKIIGKPLNQLWLNETQQALFVLDNAMELPSSHKLLQLFKHSNVHIIALSKFSEPLDQLIKEVDKALIRGCRIHEVKTLSTIDSTQRTVYEVFTKYHLAANNEDQRIFEKLAEFTSGSPVIVDIAIHVLLKFVREYSENPSEGLVEFAQSIQLNKSRKSALKSLTEIKTENCFQIRAVSRELTRVAPNVASIPPTHTDVWESESEYDSWDSIAALLKSCISSQGEMLLLCSLAIFGCSPIPLALVTTMSSLIAQSSGHSHLGGILHERLMEAKLLKRYPLPVVLHSSYTPDKAPAEPQFVYVPQHIASHLWTCDPLDQAMAVALTFRALKKLVAFPEKDPIESSFYLGLISLLEEKTAKLEDKKQCFGEVYGLYLKLSHQLLQG